MKAQGVVMLFIAPDGRVIAHAADFERSAPGGYTLEDAQRFRCERVLSNAVAHAFASPVFADALGAYEKERAIAELQAKGYRKHTVVVDETLDATGAAR